MDGKDLSGILLFGSVWGMLEATLGAFLHLTNSPMKGAIMLSAGVFIMFSALRTYNPKNAVAFTFGMGIVAAFLKGIDVFLPGPVMSAMVVLRPMVAIVLESLAFGTVLYVLQGYASLGGNLFKGAATAYLSYIYFGLVFTYLKLGSSYWLGKSFPELISMIIGEGTSAALMCAATTCVGAYGGNVFGNKLLQKRLYYPMALSLTAACWLVVVF